MIEMVDWKNLIISGIIATVLFNVVRFILYNGNIFAYRTNASLMNLDLVLGVLALLAWYFIYEKLED